MTKGMHIVPCIRKMAMKRTQQKIRTFVCAGLLPYSQQKQLYIHNQHIRSYSVGAQPQKIGEYENPRKTDYKSGQFFIHNLFGYRGVILFPWTVQVFDKDENTEVGTEQDSIQTQIVPKVQTYYQALIDSRDCPHINAQIESVTFLGSTASGQSLYTIPGLDYVSHEDIQPYSSVEDVPIQHELFDKFLSFKPGSGRLPMPTETLLTWKEKNHSCLELSKVHREVTDGIRVTAMPFYLGYKEDNDPEYWWRYCIRIENLMATTVRLRERHWRIISNGSVKTVRGRGVIGMEPVLTETQPAFQFSSHVSLCSPNGHMWYIYYTVERGVCYPAINLTGNFNMCNFFHHWKNVFKLHIKGIFRMERVDGFQFDARIPAYALESKPTTERPTTPT